jgi:hypothetical protein
VREKTKENMLPPKRASLTISAGIQSRKMAGTMNQFSVQIHDDLGAGMAPDVAIREISLATLPSWFAVSELAVASFRAAAAELGDLLRAEDIVVDRRLALKWFGMTLRPIGWDLPPAWDALAGDYAAADGWIRCHTNAPHHRQAALSILGCGADRGAVSDATRCWKKSDLEHAIAEAGGAAAAMLSLAEWTDHPQGEAVAREPLIAWTQSEADRRSSFSLRGLRVLDLTRVLAGPVATRFLAAFGADVLRIDPPDWNEPGIEPEVTVGKRCAALDLRQAEDRLAFEAMLRQADVLVHGYRPGALAGLGYGERELRRLAPTLIEVTLNAYGWTGPWAGRRGFDSLVQMSCGIADEGMRRAASDHPVPLPVQALDHATGYLMAAAVLRALRLRRDTGGVFAARLSLARTAALLASAGARTPVDEMAPETETDLAPETEHTDWGPARRLRFPLTLDGHPVQWTRPAGHLRKAPATWGNE